MLSLRLSLTSLCCVTFSLAACSGGGPDVGPSGGAPSGGTSSGGAPSGGASGGAPMGSGGALAGGAPSGGAATGGAASGGETASGGTDSGGAPSGGSASGGEPGSGGGPGAFQLTSPEWDVIDNDDCTPENTAVCPVYPEESTNLSTTGTKNKSPEMTFEGVPEGTQSFAVVLGDLTNGMAHWVIWDIPASVTTLEAGLPGMATLTEPEGARQVSFGSGYFGSGACGNVYEHRVYALKIPQLNPAMSNSAGAVRTAIMALGDDILGESFARMQSRGYCTP